MGGEEPAPCLFNEHTIEAPVDGVVVCRRRYRPWQTTKLRCHFRRLPERFVGNSGLTQALRNLQSSQSEIAIANWAILHAAGVPI